MILVCEPQCQGHEHVEFNAALLSSAYAAFQEPVRFLAEPAHLRLVAQRSSKAGIGHIEFEPIAVPPRHEGGVARMRLDWRLHRKVLARARDFRARITVFSSTTSTGLFALKLLARTSDAPCAAVPHAVLESIGDVHEKWFPRIIRMPHSPNFRILLLSSAIETEVLRAVPTLAGATAAIEHPYLFAEPAKHSPTGHRLRFASIGVAHRDKGFAELLQLAQSTLSAFPGEVSFFHVGPLRDACFGERARGLISYPASRDFLDRAAFEREVSSADYVLFLYPPRSYRFSVSGAFFDAVSLLKPVIAIRNPFFEHCFHKMGDIGYLCDTVAEMTKLLHDLCSSFPTTRYFAQQEQLLRGREVFSPGSVAIALRRAFQY